VIVVAIRECAPGAGALPAALAAAIGAGPAQLAARLAGAGGGPTVVATAADPAKGAALAAAIGAAGYDPLTIDTAAVETDASRFDVRSPRFDGAVLHALPRQGGALPVDCRSVELILRGTAYASAEETTTTRTRKFSLGKALLTQGLAVTKTVEQTARRTVESHEGFLLLFAPGIPTVALREGALVYDDFGPLRQPARAANFAVLAAELRRLCTRAVFDDRLLTRAGQARLLGPTLSPERHLDLAIALLARTLRPQAAPGQLPGGAD
jgi:hypothetical protein